MMAFEDDELTTAIGSLGTIQVPSVLHARIQLHQEHLTELASALLAGGQSRESVRQAIEIVMDSFKLELTATIATLLEKKDAQ